MTPTTINNRHHAAVFLGIREVGEGVFEVRCSMPAGFSYAAGQYVWIELPTLKTEDPRGNRRAFSIVNAPLRDTATPEIAIIFRASDSGYKQTLIALAPQTPVTVIGPFGSAFTFPENLQTPLVLLSGGVGIAPFLYLIRSTKNELFPRRITLLQYDDEPARTPYASELPGMETSTVHIRTSREHPRADDLAQLPDLRQSLFFVSGPQAFVDAVQKVADALHLKPEQFVYEESYPTTPATDRIADLLDLRAHPSDAGNVFHEALDNSSSHVVILDLNGAVRYANRAAERITGFSVSEMLGQTPRLWGGLMPPEFYRTVWSVKKNGIPLMLEVTNRRKNGEIYYAVAHISAIREKDAIIGFLLAEEDITLLKTREQELGAFTDRFMQATRVANIATWEWDITHDRLADSSLLVELYGVDLSHDPRGALAAWTSIMHPEDRATMEEELRRILKDPKRPFNMKYRIVRPSGEAAVIRSIADVQRDAEGRALSAAGLSFDISKEEAMDRAKTEFVLLATHQLKTPIGALAWNIESFLGGTYGTLTAPQKEAFMGMQTISERMRVLVGNLLEVLRIELGLLDITLEPTQYRDAIESVMREYAPVFAQRHISIKTDCDATIGERNADRRLLSIILHNLISNASKYTPEHGTIEAILRTAGGQLVVEVRNTGNPIPADEQPKIFTRFFRATEAMKMAPDGSGLGLYLVKEIVDMVGGTAGFASEPAKGTVFWVKFPENGMQQRKIVA